MKTLYATALWVLWASAAWAQTQQTTDQGQIQMVATDGEVLFTSPSIYANLFLTDGVLSLRCKAATFLGRGTPIDDSLAFSSLFNLGGSSDLEFAGKLPAGFSLKPGTTSRKVTVTGFLKVGGLRRQVSYPMVFSYDGKRISYRLDTMVDGFGWGLTMRAEQRKRFNGHFRLTLAN